MSVKWGLRNRLVLTARFENRTRTSAECFRLFCIILLPFAASDRYLNIVLATRSCPLCVRLDRYCPWHGSLEDQKPFSDAHSARPHAIQMTINFERRNINGDQTDEHAISPAPTQYWWYCRYYTGINCSTALKFLVLYNIFDSAC